eukprot:TRINITY_DN7823_c0_g1_i1.p1 TRINITY_DN7823_c0_g1~~TRINITY_DN7823_c0_g1_i1.p1  ORF type:complete len:108 (-),score=9.67 TRINITY_DN7823_c0_g1_i1:247-570(-)
MAKPRGKSTNWYLRRWQFEYFRCGDGLDNSCTVQVVFPCALYEMEIWAVEVFSLVPQIYKKLSSVFQDNQRSRALLYDSLNICVHKIKDSSAKQMYLNENASLGYFM